MTRRISEFFTTATLLDGEQVTLRSLNAGDHDGVVALAADLSAEERYLRFFTVHPAFVSEWALSLTTPAEGIVALGAFEAGDLIGVANYAESNQPGLCLLYTSPSPRDRS